jgi:hypothetical protein
MAYADRALSPGGYVVQVIRADDLDAPKLQQFMDLCARHELTPVLRLATVFDRANGYWLAPQPDADGAYSSIIGRYLQFLTALEWPQSEKHVIVLNEPNNGVEWQGRPDPAAYARFLVELSAALRQSLPGTRVLNAALDLYAPDTGGQPFANGWTYISADRFLDEMIAAEPNVFADVTIWNSHAYPLGAFRQPPWEQIFHFDAINDAPPVSQIPPDGIVNRGINGYTWELWKLSTYGIAPLPVLITETGWRHTGGIAGSLDAATDYPTPLDAARYLDLALRGNTGCYPRWPDDSWTPLLQDPRVIGVVLFALDGTPGEWLHTNLLMMSDTGAIIGAHPAFDLLTIYQNLTATGCPM